MKIGVPKEIRPGEKRVAITPDTASRLLNLGFELQTETGAGLGGEFSDQAYRDAGVTVAETSREIWAESDIILKIRPPEEAEVEQLREGAILISLIDPARNARLMENLGERKATVLAMDCVPRISRAQKLDVLSSMAGIAGYRAVIEAAGRFGRFFTGQMTAAGSSPPAKVLIIGAGVAGLAAIGAARSMGAVVRAFDTRPAVKQQVESMGATFLELDFEEEGTGSGGYAKVMSDEFIAAEMALFADQAKEVDIIITTALIPGRPAPELLSEELVKSMKPGSVIVDLAAEQGGNCALTEPDQVVDRHGVAIIGYTDLPSRMASQSSQLYSANVCHLLSDLVPEKDGVVQIDMEDEVFRGMTVLKDGDITWPPPPPKAAAIQDADTTPEAAEPAETKPAKTGRKSAAILVAGGIVLAALGTVAPPSFMSHLTVFVLACFVGWQVIWNVTPALHTPLMSVTNAISGIIVIGALLKVSSSSLLVVILAAIAILIASINVAGGFLVTQRMLRMFRRS